VQIALAASDADGNALALRIVTQPAHGTAGLAGNLSTYRPEPGYTGSDQFTFAAWDGSTDSNLGTVRLSVTGPPPISGPDLVTSWIAPPTMLCAPGCSLRSGRAVIRNTGDRTAAA
jgi:hypothetical protein